MKLSKWRQVRIIPTALWARRWSLKVSISLLLLLAGSGGAVWWRSGTVAPRIWAASEVPLAYWAWLAQTPAQDDLQRAAQLTNAQTLFLRAGQIDFEIAPCGGFGRSRGLSRTALMFIWSTTRQADY